MPPAAASQTTPAAPRPPEREPPPPAPRETPFDIVSFEHIEDRHERRAKTVLHWLNSLAHYFPEFERHLSDAMDEVRVEARPRPQMERELVFQLLLDGPKAVSELRALTGFTDWKVRKLLGELMLLARVEELPESRHVTHAGRGGQMKKIYCVIGNPTPASYP